MKKNWPIIILISIAIALCFQNYTPGTILSGWDTLHPEFNFGLAIKREIFGVFRSYQGLGAVAAHSDMADLPRIILLYFLSPFVPMSFLRYSYIFATLIIGPIGVYYFLKRVVFSKTPKESTIPSFLGALFYLLNLGTMQQFVVPLEMFTTQYATLPWLFLFATEYLNTKTHQKKTLVLFSITTLFSAPMAYAATLWYVYFISLILYVGSLSLLLSLRESVSRRRRSNLIRLGIATPVCGLVRNDKKGETTTFQTGSSLAKKAFTLILLTLLLNSFWIFPNIYFVLNHGSEVTQANINKLFSPQAFLYNKEFGNIQDISFLKTFLFDWNVYSGNNHFTQLLSPWIAHLKQPFVQLSGFLFAGIAFFGIIYGIFNPFDPLRSEASKLRVNAGQSPAPSGAGQCRSIKGNKILIALLPLLFLCLFFLFNDNSPTSSLYSFLQAKVPFLKEAYRFPQNKVLGIFTFLFAIYFAAGQLLITRFMASMKNQEGWRDWRASHRVPAGSLRLRTSDGTKERQDPDGTKSQYVQVVIFAVLLFYFMLPAFKGHFISPYMRIKIPEYYFEMFEWFHKEPPSGRIANLPIHSLWGWEYHDWYGNGEASFQGAGFIWFGIKQPILARDFDRWIPYNEQYYREMSYAIYSQDPKRLKIVLEKYNIKYILLDKSITAPSNPPKVLLYQETQELLGKQGFIQKVKEFGNTLFVYKVKTPNNPYLVRNPVYIYPKSQVSYEDVPYKDYKNYTTDLRHSGKPVSRRAHPESLPHPNPLPKGEGAQERARLLDRRGQVRGQARMTSLEKTSGVYYPLANLIDNQSRILPNTLKITQEGMIINLDKCHSEPVSESNASGVEMPKPLKQVQGRHDNKCVLTFPSYLDTEESIPADLLVEKNQNQLVISLYPLFPTLDIKERPAPIITKANLPQIKDIILSINKKDNFILETLPSNTPLSLGIVFLKTKEDNTITLYPSTPHEEVVPNLSTTEYYIEPCKNTREQKIFGAELMQKNSFYIFGKNVDLCMTIALSQILSKDPNYSEVLLSVAFNYKSNLPLKFCLSKLINGTCQNYRYNTLSPYFGLENKDIQDLGLQFSLDTTNSDKIEKALYKDLSIGKTSPFFLKSLPNDTLKKSLQPFSQKPLKTSTLILPYSSDKQLSADITKLTKTDGVCPNTPLSNPKLIKKQILENNKDRFIRYASLDGVLCDHFSYQNLSQNEAYLVAITSRNVKGLPSTLCITNAVSKHCDVYTRLPANKDFYTDIFLLPPQIKNANGFDINIGNLGIKKSPSINDLKSIEIIPFPYKWLTALRHSGQPEPVEGDSRISNHDERFWARRVPDGTVPFGTSQSRTDWFWDGNPSSQNDGLLVLPQSFEKGWKAYRINVKCQMSNVKCFVLSSFPFFFGEELKEHVLVNNWSNGWIVDSSAMSARGRSAFGGKQFNPEKIASQFNGAGNETIVILFLPQYLEYLGFILLLGTFTYLTVQAVRNKS